MVMVQGIKGNCYGASRYNCHPIKQMAITFERAAAQKSEFSRGPYIYFQHKKVSRLDSYNATCSAITQDSGIPEVWGNHPRNLSNSRQLIILMKKRFGTERILDARGYQRTIEGIFL
jgi:hypothetical protein